MINKTLLDEAKNLIVVEKTLASLQKRKESRVYQVLEEFLKEFDQKDDGAWFCCGGFPIEKDKCCPICGDRNGD